MTAIPVPIKALPEQRVMVDNRKDPTLNKRKLNEPGMVMSVTTHFKADGSFWTNYCVLLDRKSENLGRGMFVNLSEEYFEVIQPNDREEKMKNWAEELNKSCK